MSGLHIPPRPPTPQVLLHRLPDKPDASSESTCKPSKYIILIMGSTAVTGKVQIATSVASSLSCPLYQGDSMHESSAKAASIGTSRPAAVQTVAGEEATSGQGEVHVQISDSSTALLSGVNEARYQRMWLSKLTRTGLLFPEESRPANEGFSGFGGASSTSTSRRGSASSMASATSNLAASSSNASTPPSATGNFLTETITYVHNPVFTLPQQERLRSTNPALMVLTHPELEQRHKLLVRKAVGGYNIGVIFVPLYKDMKDVEDEEDLPILQPLDPTTMTSFPSSFGAFATKTRGSGNLESEMKLCINVDADVDEKIIEIVDGVREIMTID